MRSLAKPLLLSVGVSAALALYLVLYYNHWYFAGSYGPRWLVLTLLLTPAYLLLLHTAWAGLWRGLAWYWMSWIGLFCLGAESFDLSRVGFTGVLNLEVPMVWVPVVWASVYLFLHTRRLTRDRRVQQRHTARSLELRRRLRRMIGQPQPAPATSPVVIDFPEPDMEDEMPETADRTGLLDFNTLDTQPDEHSPDERGDAEPEDSSRFRLLSLVVPLLACVGLALPAAARAEGVDSTEPWVRPDRHDALKDESLRLNPHDPGLSAVYPAPLTGRARETFYIVIDNAADGAVRVLDSEAEWHTLGKVLSPVRKVNPAGFTASGWGEPGTLIATAVNALHIKTKHDYATGRSAVFSLLPIEFAEFDPKDYRSYFSATASLVTDIPAGSGIFGGQWAPLIGSDVFVGPPGTQWDGTLSGELGRAPAGTVPLAEDYAPQEGDFFIVRVQRHRYNPEYIEFENRFGGIIWVKELGLDAYPVGQVLKPVAGAGRFGGSLYAGPGRIRANHPGVICISTSEDGEMGGFQIIPRDHSMSSEMTSARTKTQWMVVGPLWAFDPSWEGIPPLFTDYIYPAFVPLSGKLKDGTEVSGADVFLDRFTVRARYADSADPAQYELLRPTAPLTFEALKDMTHLRIYFPRE